MKFFHNAFKDTGVKAVAMEYEGWHRNKEPNWKWIRKEITKSKALFVILTKNVASIMHTRNWVAFEIGVAAASIPQKPVYVFNEEGVDFAVPYLNHYFPHPLSSRRDFEIADYISDVRAPTAKKDFLPQIIRDPQLVYRDKMCKCPNCMTVFSYWGDRMAFKCPCCGELMIKVSPKYVR